MSRQFDLSQVSFSPWRIENALGPTKPNNGAPVYRRVLPPPVFYHQGIQQLEESSDEDEGMLFGIDGVMIY